MHEEDDSSAINVRLPDPAYTTNIGSNASSNAVHADRSTASTLAETKKQQNAAILQASLDVSIQSKNEPLALLLKSAISGINDLLKPQFGDNAIQAAASEDNTPTGTAGRIVSISTGFFEAFKKQNPDGNASDVLSNFMSTIRRGFEQGAKEAQDILQGMGVLNGDIAGNIDKTLELVRQGYADFETAQQNILSTATSVSSATPSVKPG
jgi:hypothetical protein